MVRTRKHTGLLRLLTALLPIMIGLGGTGAAVEPALSQEDAARYAAQSLRASIWLNKDADDVYQRGELLQATLQTNEDAYAVVYHVDIAGRVDILWPASRYSDGFVFGGHQYRLPAADGQRLRVGDHEGLGYIQAVVSRYPFDLRDLPLDFFHEGGATAYDFYVTGDPFLAMNEVNYAVTGLEDASDYVITNYASYYVHRLVDHPRYLCSQCHDEGYQVEPYRDSCTITIQHDYGWQNQWWGSYRYYPVYYYPTYFYIDPWSGYRWVNYWYDPWYRWPVASFYTWPYYAYDWRYSPYWTWDGRTAYQSGHRRYTPLNRPAATDGRAMRTKNALVTDARPGEDRLRAMRERTVAARSDGPAVDARQRRDGPAGGGVTEARPVARPQERFDRAARSGGSPGLRVPDQSGDTRRPSRGLRPGSADPGRDAQDPGGRTGTRRPEDRRPGSETPRDQQVRPGEPRGDGGRVWTNRRSGAQGEPRPTAPGVRPPERGAEQRRAPAEVRRGDAPTRRNDTPATPRGGTVQPQPRQPRQPAAPPPAAPPASSPTRREGGSRVQERSGQSPPPPPAAAPAPRGGSSDRSRGGEESRPGSSVKANTGGAGAAGMQGNRGGAAAGSGRSSSSAGSTAAGGRR